MRLVFLFLCLSLHSLFSLEKNTLVFCENSLEWDCEFLDHAEQSIEVALGPVESATFFRLLEKITLRLETIPEIKVHLLLSPFTLKEKERLILEQVKELYPNNFYYQLTDKVLQCPELTTTENGMKFMVVDERYFSFGGDQFQGVTKRGGIVGKGLIAQEFRRVFYTLFALWEHYQQNSVFEENLTQFFAKNNYFPLEKRGPLIMRFETSENQVPIDALYLVVNDNSHKISAEYESLIGNAQASIAISSPSFLPPSSLLNALQQAVNREVTLTLCTHGALSDSLWPTRMRYTPLLYGKTFSFWENPKELKKCKLYESSKEHNKKMVVIDAKQVIFSSYNFTPSSDKADFELLLYIDSKEVAAVALQSLAKEIAEAEEITASQAKSWYFDPFLSYQAALQEQIFNIL